MAKQRKTQQNTGNQEAYRKKIENQEETEENVENHGKTRRIR